MHACVHTYTEREKINVIKIVFIEESDIATEFQDIKRVREEKDKEKCKVEPISNSMCRMEQKCLK